MWRLGGIFRSVYLNATPRLQIRAVFALPDLDAEYKDAKLKVTERIAFHTGRPLLIGAAVIVPPKPPHAVTCPCCKKPMIRLWQMRPIWHCARPPPVK